MQLDWIKLKQCHKHSWNNQCVMWSARCVRIDSWQTLPGLSLSTKSRLFTILPIVTSHHWITKLIGIEFDLFNKTEAVYLYYAQWVCPSEYAQVCQGPEPIWFHPSLSLPLGRWHIYEWLPSEMPKFFQTSLESLVFLYGLIYAQLSMCISLSSFINESFQ